VSEKPPKNEKNQYRAEASAAELLGTISGGDAAQEFAHFGSVSKSVRRSEEQALYRCWTGSVVLGCLTRMFAFSDAAMVSEGPGRGRGRRIVQGR